ncbi:FAXDC2.2 family protein [Megaselia abdita]
METVYNNLQSNWEVFLNLVGNEDNSAVGMLWVFGSFAITTGFYWVLSGLYLFMDITGRPKALQKYRIQKDRNNPLDMQKLQVVIKQVLFNQFVMGAFSAVVFHLLMKHQGYTSVEKLPSLFTFIFHIGGCLLCNEVGAYYIHRFLHHKRIYKYIHKVHHEYTAPIAATASYCHPLEYVLNNLSPVYLGLYVTNCHVVTGWVYFAWVIFNAVHEHSGYHLPFLPSTQAHDFHHAKFNVNYGIIGLLDWMHGTDATFRKNIAFKRHKRLFGLKPVDEIYPADRKRL